MLGKEKGKAVGPDDVTIEVWKCLRDTHVVFLIRTRLFNKMEDIQSYRNYRGVKSMSHTMKIWKRAWVRRAAVGFHAKKENHRPAILVLRMLMEKCRDGQKELPCVFVDLEKTFHRVTREELWCCMCRE